jgi:hypothetical protein
MLIPMSYVAGAQHGHAGRHAGTDECTNDSRLRTVAPEDELGRIVTMTTGTMAASTGR